MKLVIESSLVLRNDLSDQYLIMMYNLIVETILASENETKLINNMKSIKKIISTFFVFNYDLDKLYIKQKNIKNNLLCAYF